MSDKINVSFKLEDIPMIIETMEQLQQENKELKDRIDKSIEYIKNIDEDEFINTEHYVEILNFLEGGK